MTEREKMLAGQLYDPLDAELARGRERARDLCHELNHLRPSDQAAKRRLCEQLFGSGGASLWLEPPFQCDYGANIHFGEKCFVNFNCVFLDVCEIRIGSNVQIGPATQILTPLHPFNAEQRRREEYGRPVSVGDDVWIGGGAILCPGVTIGAGSIIGAGSVVTRPIPAGVLAVGNPCRVLRQITE
jgi:maltose O-acetyltransferase